MPSTDGYKYAIPSYVAALPGSAGTNGVTTRTPPWVVHFASPQDVANSAYAVLSVALASAEANYTVSLNGQPLTWSKLNASDAAVRSGLSGYTQWVAFQWDASALNPAGQDNILTISVNSAQATRTMLSDSSSPTRRQIPLSAAGMTMSSSTSPPIRRRTTRNLTRS